MAYRDVLHLFDPDLRARVLKSQAQLFFLEGRHWQDQEQWQRALGGFIAATFLEPDHPLAGACLAGCLSKLDQGAAAQAIHDAFTQRKTDPLTP